MSDFRPYAEYLSDLDILMVYLREGEIAQTREGANVWTNIDLDAEGNVVEVEFVNAAGVGVELAGVPEGTTIARLIREAGITVPLRAPA
jgi:uncharacterized protein YuzE